VPEVNKKQFHNLYEVLSQVCLRQLAVIDIFLIMLPRVRWYEKSQFQCLKTSLLLVLEQNILLPGYRKSYPRNPEMTYISRSNQGHDAYLRLKMSIT
jgi:hypothetical protein